MKKLLTLIAIATTLFVACNDDKPPGGVGAAEKAKIDSLAKVDSLNKIKK